MKKVFILMLTGLLVIALSAGAAWAKPDDTKKSEPQGKTKVMQSYMSQYHAMLNGDVKVKGNKFKDTATHWANAPIQRMAGIGLFAGYSDGTFKPNNKMSQAEMIALVMRLVDENNEHEDNFNKDDNNYKGVPAWARDSYKKAVNHKYLNLNRFHSAQQATRAKACVMIAKALEDKDYLDVDDVMEYKFADNKLIANDDLPYIMAMYQAGYIKGNPGNLFLPNNGITRAEMAAILENILDDLKDKDNAEDDADLADLESDLKADDAFQSIGDVEVNDIELSGDEDRVDVEVKVNLDNNDEDWDDLDDSDIEEWLEDLVADIQNDEDLEDTFVSGEIIDIETYSDDVLVFFEKDGDEELSVDFDGEANVKDIEDVEDDLVGTDEYDVADIEFKINFINFNNDDEIIVRLKAQDDVDENDWDELSNDELENDVADMCNEISETFEEDANADPESVKVRLYNNKGAFLQQFEYNVADKELVD